MCHIPPYNLRNIYNGFNKKYFIRRSAKKTPVPYLVNINHHGFGRLMGILVYDGSWSFNTVSGMNVSRAWRGNNPKKKKRNEAMKKFCCRFVSIHSLTNAKVSPSTNALWIRMTERGPPTIKSWGDTCVCSRFKKRATSCI